MKVLVNIEVDTDLDLIEFKSGLEEELFYYFGNRDFSLEVEEIE